jgi:hypothetical protein
MPTRRISDPQRLFDAPLARRRPNDLILGLAAVAVLLLYLPTAALATITWDAIEPVDQPVTEVASTSGASAVFADGVWHVVYCRDGQVRHRARSFGGWQAVETVSTSPGTARDPHLAWTGSVLFVAWEDNRTGIPEVWLRTWNGGTWSAETCLTEDAVPSRAPVLAASGERVLVAWEEGDAPVQVRGRYYSGFWHAPETISGGAGSASQPTLTLLEPLQGTLAVAWVDTRHGPAEIYLRRWEPTGSWLDEVRATDLPGECGHPSMKGEFCCGDYLQTHLILTYEHTAPGGVTEVWASCGDPSGLSADRISPDDGVPSVLPAAASFPFAFNWFLGGAFPRPFVTWTDVRETNHHGVQEGSFCPWLTNPIETLSEAGLSHATVAAAAGNPDAHLITLWAEEVAGVPTLLSRRGALPGCTGPDPKAPPALLLAPGGTPADTLVMLDECSHEPLANQLFSIEFSTALARDLTWDPLQQHPMISVTTDAQGRAVFSLRGGGCSRAGAATAYFDDYGLPVNFKIWEGAKSPDLDGDCVVRQKDLEAVQAALGTDDFCADLDGNGLVDPGDVAIVEAALGQHCSNVTGIDSEPAETGLRLAVDPNPSRGRTMFSLRGASSPVRIRILDVLGRQVRALAPTGAGRESARIEWDGRDDHGRAVPSGLYVIAASGAGREARRSLLMLR